MNINPETVIKGEKPGPRLAIFAAIHGNETVGVKAFEKILSEITIEAGEVHFIIANPLALQASKRQLAINMNCIFKEDLNKGAEAELERAKELKQIMDQSDALLDIHSFNDPEGEPFLICRPDMYALATSLPFQIVTTGWNNTHPGSTDWYMETIDKPALGVECGSLHKPNEYVPLAIQTIYGFLKYFHCITTIPEKYRFSVPKNQNFFVIEEQVHKQSDAFFFTKNFKNFSLLEEGEKIAVDGDAHYLAKEGQFILFPRADKPVGGEVFLLGRKHKAF